jgi:hypothetical protein
MDRRSALKASGALIALGATGCSSMPGMGNWIPLFDGGGTDAFNPIGKANWRVVNGVLDGTITTNGLPLVADPDQFAP